MVEKSELYVVYVVSHRPYPIRIHEGKIYFKKEEAEKVRDELNSVASGLKIYKVYPAEIQILKEET